ncbi:hypothetical protein LR48_Vigan09g042600 [Vigna angularis]|uniref:Uncharacterized protein n=1 Tax=Phaseolus angularis TaxID=3914 RepID=A0A0L9VA32_PHAAN|nr:hypothetical protein LR48_Vigan09g042600 [Vigna angularis]
MNSTQWAVVEPFSEAELTNAMLEMSTPTSMLVEALRIAHEGYEKKQADLQLYLNEPRRQLGETTERLRDARARSDRLVEECGQLKVAAIKHTEREKELSAENNALTSRLEQANEKIVELNVAVVVEHEEGFNKALHQACFLFGVTDQYSAGFDIEKEIIGGEMV